MNLYQRQMMNAPSIFSEYCVFCGKPKQSQHHIIPRSQGGSKGPTVSVCGFGNESGCHGLLHAHRLHLRYVNGWQYLLTDEPMKYDSVLDMDGWRNLRTYHDYRR